LDAIAFQLFLRPFCEVLISPLSTALIILEIMKADFTIMASVGHSLKRIYK
jgi:hypothetical protein